MAVPSTPPGLGPLPDKPACPPTPAFPAAATSGSRRPSCTKQRCSCSSRCCGNGGSSGACRLPHSLLHLRSIFCCTAVCACPTPRRLVNSRVLRRVMQIHVAGRDMSLPASRYMSLPDGRDMSLPPPARLVPPALLLPPAPPHFHTHLPSSCTRQGTLSGPTGRKPATSRAPHPPAPSSSHPQCLLERCWCALQQQEGPGQGA